MKIVGIIKPFDLTQRIYVFNEGDNIETVSTTLEDFNNVIFSLCNKYNITNIDLAGAKKFNNQIKENLIKENITKYNINNLSINII